MGEGTGRVIVSVGRQHGIAIGDQFSLLATGDAGIEPAPVLEVDELIDEDLAACRILGSAEALSLGSKLLPILDPNKPPCFAP
jgi:hypothetical protein